MMIFGPIALPCLLAVARSPFARVLPWLGLLLLIVIVGAVVVMSLRRSLTRRHDSARGYTLHDLRSMHAAGELSDEEFELARQSIIRRVSESPPSKNIAEEGPEKRRSTGT